jgi:hypothetical protein
MMNSINRKLKKFPTSVLLTGYILFLIIAAFHYHHYDIHDFNYFQLEAKASQGNSSDLSHDFIGYCSLHHFSTTILKICSTSENLSPFLEKLNSIIIPVNLKPLFQHTYNEISPRAPPTFS